MPLAIEAPNEATIPPLTSSTGSPDREPARASEWGFACWSIPSTLDEKPLTALLAEG